MKKQKLILIAALFLAMTLILSGCGNDVISQEPENNISEKNQKTGESSNSSGTLLTLDEVLERANYPLAVAEVEIIDIIPRDTYDKYEHELLFDMSYYVFYNAKVNPVYYADDDFKIENENIIFRRFCVDESQNYTAGDKILCILVYGEAKYGNKYKNIYNPSFVGDIKSVDNEKFIIRQVPPTENLFNMDLSSSKKDNIFNEVSRTNQANSIAYIEEFERYITYYDDFKDAFVDYVRAYRVNEKKSDNDSNSIQKEDETMEVTDKIEADENDTVIEKTEVNVNETIEEVTNNIDENENEVFIETLEVNENE
jgi:hypothetical protein